MREQCRVGKSQGQSYCITQVNDKNKSRLEFENGERFQEKLKIRHRIEVKNGEMKSAHGLRRADSAGAITSVFHGVHRKCKENREGIASARRLIPFLLLFVG